MRLVSRSDAPLPHGHEERLDVLPGLVGLDPVKDHGLGVDRLPLDAGDEHARL